MEVITAIKTYLSLNCDSIIWGAIVLTNEVVFIERSV